MKNTFKICTLLCCIFCAASIAKANDKIKPEEIIAKHLESIANQESRREIKSQMILGNVQLSIKGSTAKLNGKGLVLSSGEKNLFGINLASNDYPQDRFAYDGKETKIGFIRPGAYSDIGLFLFSYKEVLKEGLMGGALSSSWALLNTEIKKPKLSYEGIKKIEGKETFVIAYLPKNGSDLNIKMYFDKSNYQHIRTEYSRFIGARMGAGGVDASAGQGETRQRLIEDFEDFQKAGSLTLPNKYKITYSYFTGAATQQAQNRNRELELKFDVVNYSYNSPLDQNSFNINEN